MSITISGISGSQYLCRVGHLTDYHPMELDKIHAVLY